MSDSKLTARDVGIFLHGVRCFKEADTMKIDTDKLAQLAGFATGKSANASWLVVRKKVLSGATFDGASTTAAPGSPKKPKAKAPVNGEATAPTNDNNDDDDNNKEATTPTTNKPAPKKRGGKAAAKPQPTTDGEIDDADTEKTPGIESPDKKKGARAKKASASDTTTNPITSNDADAAPGAAAATTTQKRKRGPNKPKDPTAAPPANKRAKKGAKATAATTTTDDAPEAKEPASLFGGDANLDGEAEEEEVGKEEEKSDDGPVDADSEDKVVA